MKNMYFLIFIFLFSNYQFIQAEDNNLDIKFRELLKKWETRDGATGTEISPKISKILVIDDSLFFELMYNKQDDFNEWVDKLQYQTFTAYKAEDSVDRILYRVMLLKLKDLMKEKVEKYLNHPKYREMAQKLNNELSNIYIRFIE